MEKRPRLYEKDEQVSDFLYFTTLSLYFGNALRLQVGIATLLCYHFVHWKVTIHRSLLQKSFPVASLCVNGGWCQTVWSQLKEAHAMVFGVSLQRTNKWLYISAFSHGRVGAIFTREQRTSLLLTCFTLFRWFCVSASLRIGRRFSHILLQKSSQKLNSCGEGEKCNQFHPWPFLVAWIGKRTLFASPVADHQIPLVLLPFAVVRAVLSLSRNCWGKEQREMTVICGKGGY